MRTLAAHRSSVLCYLNFPRLKVFGATFFQKGRKKSLTQANSLLRFFFDTQGAKKKAWQKETPFYGLCPDPQAFEKA